MLVYNKHLPVAKLSGLRC